MRRAQIALVPAVLLNVLPVPGLLAQAPVTPIAVAETSTQQLPDAYKLNMLIRTTLIALSQANQTGNYSVLRDLGTPQFQASNTDARLGEIFATLRNRGIDFSPILFFDPKLVRPAAIQPNGMLRMTGYIDTRPERVLFDMGFELINSQWRLSAIIVDMQTPPAAAQTPKAAAKDKAKTPPAKAPQTATTPAKDKAPAH
ncbi:MAG TPA: hypothetical protein VNR88_10635 [Hyphomicrobium sp.]|nr:hypothetical protein [Hyphomicrobium sp.]